MTNFIGCFVSETQRPSTLEVFFVFTCAQLSPTELNAVECQKGILKSVGRLELICRRRRGALLVQENECEITTGLRCASLIDYTERGGRGCVWVESNESAGGSALGQVCLRVSLKGIFLFTDTPAHSSWV